MVNEMNNQVKIFHISPFHMLMFYCGGKHLLNTAWFVFHSEFAEE